MSNSRVLWKVLCNPEKVTKDERMDQIEWKGYYWSYKTLILLLWALLYFVSLQIRTNSWVEFDAQSVVRFFLITLFGAVLLLENERFLYSCYHGTQEFADRYRGRTIFLINGFWSFFYGWLGFTGLLGVKNPWTYVCAAAGMIFYWALCHLAYLRFALVMEDETGEKGRSWEEWIGAACGVLLAIYFVVLGGIGFKANLDGKYGIVQVLTISQEEQQYLTEIQKGTERYYELDSEKMECTHTWEPGQMLPIEEGGIAHCYYWITPERLFTQILDEQDGNSVYREYYRDEQELWYMERDGVWVGEQELKEEAETELLSYTQPITGLTDIKPQYVDTVTKEERDGQQVYTVTYKNGCKYASRTRFGHLKARKPEKIQERYSVNEYDVLTEYEYTEEGTYQNALKPYSECLAFQVLSVNAKENEAEVEKLIGQYQ